MQWAGIEYFHLLWVVVAVIFFYRIMAARRQRALWRFAEESLVNQLLRGMDRRRRRIKKACLLTALIMIILSLAEPKWGYHWQRVTREGVDIVIAVDTSKSMLAQDVRPNRLERAKMEIRELVEVLKGDRVALVAFAGNSYTLCPPTLDHAAIQLFLQALKVGVVPMGGTDIGGAIEDAVEIFQESNLEKKALILISDGEDHRGNVEEAARKAADLGVKIFSVGIGSSEGELIPVEGDEGRKAYFKDAQGNVVQTKLSEGTLEQLALLTGGAYVRPAGGRLGLVDLYHETILGMEKEEFGERQRKVYENRYRWPLAIAFILLGMEMLLRERKRDE